MSWQRHVWLMSWLPGTVVLARRGQPLLEAAEAVSRFEGVGERVSRFKSQGDSRSKLGFILEKDSQ